ncbi:MAG TPA: HTH domain-containing protein [Ignavibacteriales bacterium]|nr:HTH domain-containing protein [Ignavibacteriales bacterium]
MLSKQYDKLLTSVGKTPWATIGARIYVDMRDNPSSNFIKLDGERPVRLFLKDLGKDYQVKVQNNEKERNSLTYNERDLRKYLTYYVYTYKEIYTKTIYQEASNKKQFTQWVHPDIVGVYFHIDKWENEVLEIAGYFGNPGLKLFSFELKKKLDFNNLRESFFQEVSNSSWANEGYLVAEDILEYDDFYKN